MAEITNVLTCPTCGGKLEFLPGVTQMQCLHCGNKVQIGTGPVCPQCGRAEQVQKVSGLYEGNTKEWQEGRHNTTRQARTLLGQKLAPPPEPSYPISPLILYGFGGVALISICPGPFFMLLPVGLGISQALEPSGLTSLICLGLMGLFALGAVVGGLVWVVPAMQRHFARVLADYEQAKAKVDAEEKPRWQRAMTRWNNLHYCARDETLFTPGENQALPLEKMQDYLFEAN